MSMQKEHILPFTVFSKETPEVPVEAELAFVLGIVNDKIKRGGLFKRVKEDLVQVSKFYWKIYLDSYQNNIVFVDSIGFYGNGSIIHDLSLAEIRSQIKMIEDATNYEAYHESLEEANNILMLANNNYPVFNKGFTESLANQIPDGLEQENIDVNYLLPTFEDSLNEKFIKLLNELPEIEQLANKLEQLTKNWGYELENEITHIEEDYARRIKSAQEEAERRIQQYEQDLHKYLDSNLRKANESIHKELSIFESNANGLTGIITPIQETTRQTIQEVPSIETPKFEKYIQGFFSEAKNEIGAISAKVKGLDQNRKDLEKNIQSIIRTFNDYANNAKDKFEEQKTEALKKVDRMRMDRDKRISELSQLKESIDENAETLVKNLHTVIRNRKKLAKHSTFKLNRNAPTEVTLALYLVQLQEKGKARYFVIPPITFKQKGSETDYPTIYKNSAIQGEQKIMDKIAEELVFNRRLKDTFKTLKENNYVKSGEFKDAVKEGLKFLVSNKLLSKKLAKEINGFTSDINLR